MVRSAYEDGGSSGWEDVSPVSHGEMPRSGARARQQWRPGHPRSARPLLTPASRLVPPGAFRAAALQNVGALGGPIEELSCAEVPNLNSASSVSSMSQPMTDESSGDQPKLSPRGKVKRKSLKGTERGSAKGLPQTMPRLPTSTEL